LAITLFSLTREAFFRSSNNELEVADPDNIIVGFLLIALRKENKYNSQAKIGEKRFFFPCFDIGCELIKA
jgi:hypothetical protein